MPDHRKPGSRSRDALYAIRDRCHAVQRGRQPELPKDEAGEWKKETEWFRVVLFRENAERAAEWLRKGTKVFIEGRIQTRQYEKDGQTHYMTELIADRFANLDPRQRDEDGGDDTRASRPVGPGKTPAAVPAGGDDFDDPIPF